MADGKVPKSLRARVFREDGLVCRICGIKGHRRPFGKGGYGYYTDIENVYMSIDHIVPVSKGGTNERSNLRVLCTRCNSKKSDNMPAGKR